MIKDFKNQLYQMVEIFQLLQPVLNNTPQSKSCLIRAGTIHSVYTVRCTVQSGYPVQSRPGTFFATNVAGQDHSGHCLQDITLHIHVNFKNL